MIEDLFDTIDNDTGEILSRAVKKLGKRLALSEARDAMAERKLIVSVSLDPINAPWPSDGFASMAERVNAVRRMTPKDRALTAIMHRDTPPAGLTTSERRNWLEGLGQAGG